jgi:hypothetical protein
MNESGLSIVACSPWIFPPAAFPEFPPELIFQLFDPINGVFHQRVFLLPCQEERRFERHPRLRVRARLMLRRRQLIPQILNLAWRAIISADLHPHADQEMFQSCPGAFVNLIAK